MHSSEFNFEQIFAFCYTLGSDFEAFWQIGFKRKHTRHDINFRKNAVPPAIHSISHEIQHAAGKLPFPLFVVEEFCDMCATVFEHYMGDGIRANCNEPVQIVLW